MFLLECKSRTGRNIKAAPESLQFTSILPKTQLVMMVPFLEGWLSTDGKGEGTDTLTCIRPRPVSQRCQSKCRCCYSVDQLCAMG